MVRRVSTSESRAAGEHHADRDESRDRADSETTLRSLLLLSAGAVLVVDVNGVRSGLTAVRDAREVRRGVAVSREVGTTVLLCVVLSVVLRAVLRCLILRSCVLGVVLRNRVRGVLICVLLSVRLDVLCRAHRRGVFGRRSRSVKSFVLRFGVFAVVIKIVVIHNI